jgi:tetratricopeptide (TPR) repeat protein
MKGMKVGCGVVPGMFLVLNFGVSDQSRNYTAYEHALNIFRTTERGDFLLVEGDNNLFPVIYGRLVERMGDSLIVYDLLNVVFRWPRGGAGTKGSYEEARAALEKSLIREAGKNKVFFAVFAAGSETVPNSHILVPYGVLQMAVEKQALPYKVGNMWQYYAVDSLYENLQRDFMNRQVYGHLMLKFAQHLFASGDTDAGKRVVANASRRAFGIPGFHLHASMILIHEGFFEMARAELEEADLCGAGASLIHAIWGHYYVRRGEYETAVASFEKAIQVGGRSPVYYKNLLLALKHAGRMRKAAEIAGELREIFPWAWEDGDVEESGSAQ